MGFDDKNMGFDGMTMRFDERAMGLMVAPWALVIGTSVLMMELCLWWYDHDFTIMIDHSFTLWGHITYFNDTVHMVHSLGHSFILYTLVGPRVCLWVLLVPHTKWPLDDPFGWPTFVRSQFYFIYVSGATCLWALWGPHTKWPLDDPHSLGYSFTLYKLVGLHACEPCWCHIQNDLWITPLDDPHSFGYSFTLYTLVGPHVCEPCWGYIQNDPYQGRLGIQFMHFKC